MKLKALITFLLVCALSVLVCGCVESRSYNVKVNGGVITDTELTEQTFESGTTASITATVPEGKQFVEWRSEDVKVSSDNPYKFTVVANVKLTAVFADLPYVGLSETERKDISNAVSAVSPDRTDGETKMFNSIATLDYSTEVKQEGSEQSLKITIPANAYMNNGVADMSWACIDFDLTEFFGNKVNVADKFLEFDVKVENGQDWVALRFSQNKTAVEFKNETLDMTPQKDYDFGEIASGFSIAKVGDFKRISADMSTLYNSVTNISLLRLCFSSAYGDYTKDTVIYIDNLVISDEKYVDPNPEKPKYQVSKLGDLFTVSETPFTANDDLVFEMQSISDGKIRFCAITSDWGKHVGHFEVNLQDSTANSTGVSYVAKEGDEGWFVVTVNLSEGTYADGATIFTEMTQLYFAGCVGDAYVRSFEIVKGEPIVSYAVSVEGGEGAGTFISGASATVTATVPTGKTFVKWVDGDNAEVSTANPYTFAVSENTSLKAVFTDITFNVSIKGNESEDATVTSEIYNADVTATATPADGKVFVKWIDGESNTVSINNPYTFKALSDVTLIAVFEDEAAPAKYTVIVTNGTGDGEYDADAEVTATATVPVNKKFVKWIDSENVEVSTENPYVFSATKSISLTAVFEDDYRGAAFTVGNAYTNEQAELKSYQSVSFEYIITNGEDAQFQVAIFDSGWTNYFGCFDFKVAGSRKTYDGIVCETLADGYIKVTITFANVTRTGNANNTSLAPTQMQRFWIKNGGTASGYIDNITFVE